MAHVRMKCGRHLDSVELWWLKPDGNYEYRKAGGSGGGTTVEKSFGPTNQMVRADVRTETGNPWVVNWMSVQAQDGSAVECVHWVCDPWCRNNKVGEHATVVPPDGKKIHGFLGRAGKYVDRIGFISYYFIR
jgi:hypothetical protein